MPATYASARPEPGVYVNSRRSIPKFAPTQAVEFQAAASRPATKEEGEDNGDEMSAKSTRVQRSGDCDDSVREKDWRCRKRGKGGAQARQSDLAGVARARQRHSFERMHL